MSSWIRRVALLGLFALVAASSPPAAQAAPVPLPPWTIYHHDLARTGLDTTSPVFGSAHPGWTSPQLDGPIYTEPLVSGTNIYVGTESDTLYSLDATTGAIVWATHLGAPAAADTRCSSIPFEGITSTPVIDPVNGIIYVVAYALPGHNALVAVRMTTGAVLWWKIVDPPQDDPIQVRVRSALVMSGGMIYMTYGSRDCSVYHGWVLATSVSGAGPLLSFMVPPTAPGFGASMWAPSGPAVDAAGNLFVATSDAYNASGYDYSDSVLKLSPTLGLLDSFAPANWAALSQNDLDLGSVGPSLLNNGLVFTIGKQGVGYLLQATHLGGIGGQLFSAQVCSTTGKPPGAYGGTAYMDPYIYVPCGEGLVALKLGAGPSFTVVWRGPTNTTPGSPVVSGGVVWVMSRQGYLYALDAMTGRVKYLAWPGAPTTHFPSLSAGNGQLFVTLGNQIAQFLFTSTPSATIGGHGFNISVDSAGGRHFSWLSGTAQTGYILNHMNANAVTLPGSATSYVDTSTSTQALDCYQLTPTGPTGALGLSDVLCAWPKSQSATGVPTGFTLSLNESPTASLKWTAPGGQTAYILGAYSMTSGIAPRYISLPGFATSTSDDLMGISTCYELVAMNGATAMGNSPALCSGPGSAILPFVTAGAQAPIRS